MALRVQARAPRPQAPSRNRAEHAFGLVGLVARARLARTGDTRGDAYLEVLDRALEDGVITDNEVPILREVASSWGLTPQHVNQLHTHYINTLTKRHNDTIPEPAIHHQLAELATILDNGHEGTEIAIQLPEPTSDVPPLT